MPASSPSAGDGTTPSRSASTIAFGAVSGGHVLKIAGYSHSKVFVLNGESIRSCSFDVGGRSWHVEYSPNGRTPDNTDSISLYLALDDVVSMAVKAKVKISLLDQDGEPVPSHSFTTVVVNFTEKRSWGYQKFIQREVLEKSGHLRDDSFSARFDVTVMKDVLTEETPFVAVPPSNLHLDLGALLSSKEGTDVRFRIRRRTFAAHRSVLAARSPVFKKALLGQMKEGNADNIVRIDDIEAEVFAALLKFMYTDALPEMKKKDESAMAQHLLVAADRYNLQRLKLICEDKLCEHIDVGSAATLLALAEQHNCLGLKEACFKFLSSSATMNVVMETGDFEYLKGSCPGVLKELMSKVVPC
ncbi:hypothetical protein ACP70R_021266 [Stipagrostis hirtigluma subsp. patula]